MPGTNGRYWVSSEGRARGPRGHILKGSTAAGCYTLIEAGARQWFYVHREVCRAFHGEPPFQGAMARHLNGNSRDNRAENLAWGSHMDNVEDRERHKKERIARAAAL